VTITVTGAYLHIYHKLGCVSLPRSCQVEVSFPAGRSFIKTGFRVIFVTFKLRRQVQ
jgi:hypothetical protein